MGFILLLGGARSGKSALAQAVATRSASSVCFIATAEAGDAEMADRIARHRAQRPAGWSTVEEQRDLTAAIRSVPAGDFIVIDCLTLWVSNLTGGGEPPGGILAAAVDAASALAGRAAGAVVVSNEIGLGIVPANALTRCFRDALGAVNAGFAAAADRTVMLVAGRVLELTDANEFMEGVTWPARLPKST